MPSFIDFKKDLRQEEVFTQSLVEVLNTSVQARRELLSFYTELPLNPKEAQRISIHYRERKYTWRSKKVEFDLVLRLPEKKMQLIAEIKGSGGSELPSQTSDIASVISEHFSDWTTVLLFVSPEGSRAHSEHFQSLTVEDFLAPLRADRFQHEKKTASFLQALEQDYHSSEVALQRKTATQTVKRLAEKLQYLAQDAIDSTPELKGFKSEIERAYKRDRAAIQLARADNRWHGFVFEFSLEMDIEGKLHPYSFLHKGGRKNVTGLRQIKKYLDIHPVEKWQSPLFEIRSEFSAKKLVLVQLLLDDFEETKLQRDFAYSITHLLLPAIPLIDGFLKESSLFN